MTSRRFVWTKFFFSLIPILLLGQLLIIASSIFIGIDKVFILLMMGTTLLLCSSLVSMTLAFGTNDIQRGMKETDREQPQTASVDDLVDDALYLWKRELLHPGDAGMPVSDVTMLAAQIATEV